MSANQTYAGRNLDDAAKKAAGSMEPPCPRSFCVGQILRKSSG